MGANIVDPNCSSSPISIADLIVPSGKTAIFRLDVPAYAVATMNRDCHTNRLFKNDRI